MKVDLATATVLGAVLALVGAALSTGLAQWGAAKLEDRRARTEIVLEMMRSNGREQMLQKLQVLVASHLLDDEDGKLRQAVSEAPPKAFLVQVAVPVAIKPIKPGDVPTPPPPLPPRRNFPALQQQEDILLADHCSWVAYGLRADVALRVSAGLPQKPLAKYPECERP